MLKTLIVILGPTGVGKSRVAVRLAEQLGSEIISSDSRQFYSELRIGTAVPNKEDLDRIPHHFIQHKSVKSYYSASMYEEDALRTLSVLFKSHSKVVMAGGSGLYIDAVCGSIDEIPDIIPEIRSTYIQKLEQEGIQSLRQELKLVDPDYYEQTDLKNPKRILRALEIYGSTGQAYSTFLKKGGKKRDFNIVKIGLAIERDILYKNIDNRADRMIAEGLEEEARSVYHLKDLNALNTVGYKEFFSYFENEITKDKAIELIKRNSRRYAKRQITWWSRDKEIKWFHPDDISSLIEFASEA